jgi:iron complex outermembrane receptor protein
MLALLILGSAIPMRAQDPKPQSGSGEEKELAELLSIMQEETAVATKTRMNSDYVPGIVTVLHGDELEALGIATAWEALGLVPGIQAIRDGRSSPSTIVRGIDFPFNSGNIQILINGIPLTREDAGINASALLIPVEQIDRIEVIRGPGSVIYGNFAFMGLVNVITRDEGTRAFARLDSSVALTGGARLGFKSAEGRSKTSFSLSRYTSDDAPAATPNSGDDRWFGLFAAQRGGFSVNAQLVTREFGTPAPPAATYTEESWAVEGRYRRDFGKLNATARVAYLANDIDNQTSSLVGDLVKAGADFVWTGLAHQSWFASAERSQSTIDEAFHTFPPPPGRPPVRTLLATDKERTITGVTLQDTIDIHARVNVTVGARFDSYSDLDDRVTPRLAIVWRATDRHILKAQYAEGYRPPTFFELYSPRLPAARYPFEVNATTELNYVYRATDMVGRATLFHSTISDMIRPGGFVTPGDTIAKGFELEWTQQVTPAVKVDANLSRTTTEDARINFAPNAVSPEWLGNLSLLWRPVAGIVVGGRLNHIGDRPNGDGYDTVDFTASRQDLILPGLDLRAGVKNVLDDDVTYQMSVPQGVVTTTFPGRTFFVQLSWRR